MTTVDDFARMVERSGVEPAKKTVAMTFVRAMRVLDESGEATVESIAHTQFASAYLLLEMYLRDSASVEHVKAEVDNVVSRHAEECAAEREKRTAENNDGLSLRGKPGVIYKVLSKAGGPGVAVFFMIYFGAEIRNLLKAIAECW